MVGPAELEDLLARGHEMRRLEVKGAGLVRRNERFVAKVARAVMSMGNLRDGGLVVIGIADDQIAAMLPGLDDAQLAEWSDFDLVSAALGKYSDPPISFEIHPLTLKSRARVVVLEVAEFERDIHVCKKNDREGVLRDGQTYVRPRGKPESVPVPSAAAARELHDLAIDKGVREFLRRAGAVGLPLRPALAPEELNAQTFSSEFELGWADPNPVTDPKPQNLGAWVTEPGFTDVAVRPVTYIPDRLSPTRLEPFVVEHTVSMRGWPVPFVDHRHRPVRHGTWIAQDIAPEVVPHGEAWRMFGSGQFLHRRLLATDLRDAADLKPEAAGATGAVAVWDVLLYMVEVAEFGARMATALRLDQVAFDVALAGVGGRELVSGDFSRQLHGPYVANPDRFEGGAVVDVSPLLDDPRGVGVRLAQSLFEQFGLDVPDSVLFEWQDQIFNRARH